MGGYSEIPDSMYFMKGCRTRAISHGLFNLLSRSTEKKKLGVGICEIKCIVTSLAVINSERGSWDVFDSKGKVPEYNQDFVLDKLSSL